MISEYSGLRDTSVRSFGNRCSGELETTIPVTGNQQSGNGNQTCDTLELGYAPRRRK